MIMRAVLSIMPLNREIAAAQAALATFPLQPILLHPTKYKYLVESCATAENAEQVRKMTWSTRLPPIQSE